MADNLSLGDKTILNIGCEVRGDVQIGNYCAIGRHVIFQGRNHKYDTLAVQDILYEDILKTDPGEQKNNKIRIGNDVWIGNRVIILPGVSIGNGAIVGAGAVVTRNIEPFEVVGGVPAEHIKWRFPEDLRAKISKIEWWNWSDEQIKQNSYLFEQTQEEIEIALENISIDTD